MTEMVFSGHPERSAAGAKSRDRLNRATWISGTFGMVFSATGSNFEIRLTTAARTRPTAFSPEL
jgi:hypothetical protein